MGDYPTSSAVQDLATRIESLTFETSGIGHQLGRIADHLTGQSTGFGPQTVNCTSCGTDHRVGEIPEACRTTAPDSVQSTSGGQPVDPEDPSWVVGSVAYASFSDGSGGERVLRTITGWHGERGPIRVESYPAYRFYRLAVVRTVELPVHDLEHPLRNSDGSEVDPDSGLPHHTFKSAQWQSGHCQTWFGDHQCKLPADHPAHTLTVGPLADLETVERMRTQIAVDRLTPYWADRGDHLDSVESYLDSLKDHLS